MIEACALGVTRAGIDVLDDINLNLGRGEIVGLIGPPEAGKTTLLKALAGLVPLTTGRVTVDGVPLDFGQPTQVATWQQRIGFAFQNNALFDALSVFDNVAFPLRRRQVPEAEIAPQVGARLDDVGLGHAAQSFPGALSGGMQKRVGIARATIIEPVLGLFDDPIAGLDPLTGFKILELLRRLTRALNMATVIVSNDLSVLLPMCQRIVMLCAGRVVYDGAPAGLVRSARPEVVQFATGSDEGPL